MNSLNPGAMAGSARLFCVTEIVSSFETHHTFGVPKRLALKALQKVTVLEGLPASAYWSSFGHNWLQVKCHQFGDHESVLAFFLPTLGLQAF